MSSGTAPRNGTPSRCASASAPPWPKMSERSPHLGQMNVLMFSTMPSTGTPTLRNMARPLRASISARSCGVETITAPDSGTCCAMVSCTSPVPGGMSMMSTSRSPSSPQATSRSICLSAPTTIGPRQMTGVSSSTMKPIDMTFRP